MARPNKLSKEDILEIQARADSGESKMRLAGQFGVSSATITYHTSPAYRIAHYEGVRQRRRDRAYSISSRAKWATIAEENAREASHV